MPRPHTLARRDRRHGQSPRPQGAAGRATHQGGGRGVAISPSLQSRYEPHRKSLLQAQSLPAQNRRTDRRGSAARPRNLRRNLQALGMYKLLQILRLSGRYRMIGFRFNFSGQLAAARLSNCFNDPDFLMWLETALGALPGVVAFDLAAFKAKGRGGDPIVSRILQPRNQSHIVQIRNQAFNQAFRNFGRAFESEYLESEMGPVPFGGREAELHRLDQWLFYPSSPPRML